MVFQRFQPFRSPYGNREYHGGPYPGLQRDSGQVYELAVKLLNSVGLSNHINSLPHRLSGGQQQRVGIARALAISPRLMLFDEPTSALRPELVNELFCYGQLADAGMTMIVVTHEVQFAREVADRIVFMDEGRIVEEGSPAQVLDAPTQERTQRFLRMVARGETVA